MGKFTRPIVADVLFRKRLFDLMYRIKDKPVIWVMGPPGCGKTTLVSNYIESREISCLWYQLDEGDKDLATFFYYMGLAAAGDAVLWLVLPAQAVREKFSGLGVLLCNIMGRRPVR